MFDQFKGMSFKELLRWGCWDGDTYQSQWFDHRDRKKLRQESIEYAIEDQFVFGPPNSVFIFDDDAIIVINAGRAHALVATPEGRAALHRELDRLLEIVDEEKRHCEETEKE